MKRKRTQMRAKSKSFWCTFGAMLAATVLLFLFRHPACMGFYLAAITFPEGYDADAPMYQQYLRNQPFKHWFLKKHTAEKYRRHCYGLTVFWLFCAVVGLMCF